METLLFKFEKGVYQVQQHHSVMKEDHCYPAIFETEEGTKIKCVCYVRFVTQKEEEIEYDIYATSLWFQYFINASGEEYGVMKDLSPYAITWMNSSFSSYYYDKKGRRYPVTPLSLIDEEAELKEGTCRDCGYLFADTSEFSEGGLCPACAEYDAEEMRSKRKISKLDDFKLGKTLYYSWKIADNHAHKLMRVKGIKNIDKLELKRGFITARNERFKRLGIHEDGEGVDAFYGALDEVHMGC
ncbi:hypothetical protein [Niallia taxi]|uniref:hypothetical protein n=1 Tax=Niallia taxi TaxID=2499688 RepID=UPI0015F74A22|nr:hypothetical protein [Niallia taxi]